MNDRSTAAAELSDDQLRQQLRRAREISGPQPETSASVPLLTFSPNGKCRRCGTDVEPEAFQCALCDRAVEDELQRREMRNRGEAITRELTRSGLPRDYRTGARTAADVPDSSADALKLCALLGSIEVPGLFLFGGSKAYKTTIAAAWLAGEIRRGRQGRFVDVVDLMTDITKSYSGDAVGEGRADIVARYADAPLLVLDDLGQEKASTHAGEVIRQILDNRRREWRPGHWLIVTSNWQPERLRDRFAEREIGDAVLHRIAQLTVAVPMERASV